MIIKVRKICGCCYEEIEVEEDFYFPPNKVSATITDKYGVEHTGIDTFLGYEVL